MQEECALARLAVNLKADSNACIQLNRTSRSGSESFVMDDYFYDCFIRKAPVGDNTVWGCIHTVARTYGGKILQLYVYVANCDTTRIPVHAAKKTVDCWTKVFLHQSKQYMFKLKILARNILFLLR